MKLLFGLLALFVSCVFGQSTYDYGCNHFSGTPLNWCDVSSTYNTIYSCNSTSGNIDRMDYAGGANTDCTGDVTDTFSYDTDTYGECDNDDDCGVFYYYDSNGYTTQWALTDACIGLTSTSTMSTCSGTTLNIYYYSDSTCETEDSSYGTNPVSLDYQDYYDSYYSSYGYTFMCEGSSGGSGGSSASTYSFNGALLCAFAALLMKLF